MTYTQKRYADYTADETSVTLRESGADYGGGSEVLIVDTLVFDEGQITCPTNGLHPRWGEQCHSLSGNAGRTVVVIDKTYQDVAGTLNPGAHPGSYNGQDAYNDMLIAKDDDMESTVRRLTPKECERLQGFPDDWSKYGVNNKGEVYELSDSARYRLQGNSIARPFWTWLLRRIAAQYERPATLGSLFDGQGGFPLCAVEVGIKPVWASEIEKHAIAVTRYHFPEGDAADA